MYIDCCVCLTKLTTNILYSILVCFSALLKKNAVITADDSYFGYRKTSIKRRVSNKRRDSEAHVLINAGSQLNAGLF